MDRGRSFVWIATVLVAVDLLFFSGASNFLAAPQSRILNQLIVLAVMAGFGLAVARGAVDPRSPLVLPGLAWVAATAITAAFSDRPASSLEGLALLLLAAPAYLVVRAVVWTDWLRSRVDGLVIVATTGFVVAYLLQALTQWISWWSVAGPSIPPLRPGDVGLTVGTVNAVSLYLELLAPIAIWLSWQYRRSVLLSGTIGALAMVALVVTGSRGAWLGAALGAVVFVATVWLAGGRRGPAVPRTGAARGAVVVSGVALVVIAILVGPALTARLLEGDAGRVELWTAAWSMFTGDPLFGVGPGAFPDVRPLTEITAANRAVLTTSHNSVLQVLAETGLIGCAAAVWLVVTVVRVAVRAVRGAVDADQRMLRLVAIASLVATAAHSIVDTQFHLPSVLILVFHLVSRLDPPRPGTAALPVSRGSMAIAVTGVLGGALLLVPIDIAMIRAQIGNLALDRGDAAAALPEFEAANALHELGPYRLGEAIARSKLGDLPGAADALARMDAIQPFTFVAASRARAGDAERGSLFHRLDHDARYDPTADVNAAALRPASDAADIEADLSAAMAATPTLVFSERPAQYLDDATWVSARRAAVDAIALTNPVVAAAVAVIAGEDDLADAHRSAVPAGSEARALDLLFANERDGTADLEAAQALLREAPGSFGVQDVLWLLGFEAGDQSLIDAVGRVAIPSRFNIPEPPMELVLDGRNDADYALRLPRYPMAANGRLGPKRPYIDGMVTIEPVYRP